MAAKLPPMAPGRGSGEGRSPTSVLRCLSQARAATSRTTQQASRACSRTISSTFGARLRVCSTSKSFGETIFKDDFRDVFMNLGSDFGFGYGYGSLLSE
ncbi:hypothetical protein ACJRO7_018019 [Eucalyptus globulus]|uniref:Uncharacterized protein n=1 Tax=Eucalyptus globulus TaxID=34317 RepID=A0ABD3L3B4_EUCGL